MKVMKYVRMYICGELYVSRSNSGYFSEREFRVNMPSTKEKNRKAYLTKFVCRKYFSEYETFESEYLSSGAIENTNEPAE